MVLAEANSQDAASNRHLTVERKKMKKSFFLFLLVVNLSGCVGVYFSKNGDIVTSHTDFSRTDLSVRTAPPPRVADQINPDGSEMYIVAHERKWCGLTIWAIIPIPLLLPLCQVHTEVTYKDRKAIYMASQWPTGSGLLCGPFVFIPTGMDNGTSSFCTTKMHM